MDQELLDSEGKTAKLKPGSLLGLGIPYQLINQCMVNKNLIFLQLYSSLPTGDNATSTHAQLTSFTSTSVTTSAGLTLNASQLKQTPATDALSPLDTINVKESPRERDKRNVTATFNSCNTSARSGNSSSTSPVNLQPLLLPVNNAVPRHKDVTENSVNNSSDVSVQINYSGSRSSDDVSVSSRKFNQADCPVSETVRIIGDNINVGATRSDTNGGFGRPLSKLKLNDSINSIIIPKTVVLNNNYLHSKNNFQNYKAGVCSQSRNLEPPNFSSHQTEILCIAAKPGNSSSLQSTSCSSIASIEPVIISSDDDESDYKPIAMKHVEYTIPKSNKSHSIDFNKVSNSNRIEQMENLTGDCIVPSSSNFEMSSKFRFASSMSSIKDLTDDNLSSKFVTLTSCIKDDTDENVPSGKASSVDVLTSPASSGNIVTLSPNNSDNVLNCSLINNCDLSSAITEEVVTDETILSSSALMKKRKSTGIDINSGESPVKKQKVLVKTEEPIANCSQILQFAKPLQRQNLLPPKFNGKEYAQELSNIIENKKLLDQEKKNNMLLTEELEKKLELLKVENEQRKIKEEALRLELYRRKQEDEQSRSVCNEEVLTIDINNIKEENIEENVQAPMVTYLDHSLLSASMNMDFKISKVEGNSTQFNFSNSSNSSNDITQENMQSSNIDTKENIANISSKLLSSLNENDLPTNSYDTNDNLNVIDKAIPSCMISHSNASIEFNNTLNSPCINPVNNIEIPSLIAVPPPKEKKGFRDAALKAVLDQYKKCSVRLIKLPQDIIDKHAKFSVNTNDLSSVCFLQDSRCNSEKSVVSVSTNNVTDSCLDDVSVSNASNLTIKLKKCSKTAMWERALLDDSDDNSFNINAANCNVVNEFLSIDAPSTSTAVDTNLKVKNLHSNSKTKNTLNCRSPIKKKIGPKSVMSKNLSDLPKIQNSNMGKLSSITDVCAFENKAISCQTKNIKFDIKSDSSSQVLSKHPIAASSISNGEDGAEGELREKESRCIIVCDSSDDDEIFLKSSRKRSHVISSEEICTDNDPPESRFCGKEANLATVVSKNMQDDEKEPQIKFSNKKRDRSLIKKAKEKINFDISLESLLSSSDHLDIISKPNLKKNKVEKSDESISKSNSSQPKRQSTSIKPTGTDSQSKSKHKSKVHHTQGPPKISISYGDDDFGFDDDFLPDIDIPVVSTSTPINAKIVGASSKSVAASPIGFAIDDACTDSPRKCSNVANIACEIPNVVGSSGSGNNFSGLLKSTKTKNSDTHEISDKSSKQCKLDKKISSNRDHTLEEQISGSSEKCSNTSTSKVLNVDTRFCPKIGDGHKKLPTLETDKTKVSIECFSKKCKCTSSDSTAKTEEICDKLIDDKQTLINIVDKKSSGIKEIQRQPLLIAKCETDPEPIFSLPSTSFAAKVPVIKQEIDDKPDDHRFDLDSDDDDVQMIYSQMDEYILLSSDEDEMICSQDVAANDLDESSFGPMPSSPDLDIFDLFNRYSANGKELDLDLESNCEINNAETMFQENENESAKDKNDIKISATEQPTENSKISEDSSEHSEPKKESELWFPDLSQNFYEGDDPLSDDDDQSNEVKLKVSEPSNQEEKEDPSHYDSSTDSSDSLPSIFPDNKTKTKRIPFKANVPRIPGKSQDHKQTTDNDADGLRKLVQKSQRKPTERTLLLTKAIIPPASRRSRLTVTTTESNSARSTSGSRIRELSKTNKRSNIKDGSSSKSHNVKGKSRKKSSGDSLRKSLTKSFALSSYEIKGMKSKVNDRGDLEPRSSKTNSSSRQSSSTSSNKDHRIEFNGVRDDENISIQNKSASASCSSKKPTGVAKITKKNRSSKLTEVNLFPSPNLSNQKIKSRIPSKLDKLTNKKQATPQAISTGGSKPESKSPSTETSAGTIHDILDLIDINSIPLPPPIETNTSKFTSADASVSSAALPTGSPSSSSEVSTESLHVTSTVALPSVSVDVDNISHTTATTLLPKDSDGVAVPFVQVTSRLPGGILKRSGEQRRLQSGIKFPLKLEDMEKIKFIPTREKKGACVGPTDVNYRELAPRAFEAHRVSDNMRQKHQPILSNVNSFYLNPYYFIHKVCTWNYDWLKNYRAGQLKKSHPEPPPLLGCKTMVYPTMILYETFKDYHEVFSALLFHEVWENIYKDWQKFHATNVWLKCEVDVVILKHNPNALDPRNLNTNQVNPPLNFTFIKLVTLINPMQEREGYHPRTGSLIAIKVPVEDKSTVVFAYVDVQIRYTRTVVSKELKDAIPNATSTLMLSVFASKGSAAQIKKGAILSICNISYLKPNIRIWNGLTRLKDSPLGAFVLKPGIECITPPVQIPEYIVPEMPLNPSQTKAVTGVAAAVLGDARPRISVIHGPPGTGKTRTIVSLVTQIYRKAKDSNLRSLILLCAPSNAAVDELTRRLLDLSVVNIHLKIVRNGFSGRYGVDKIVQEQSYDKIVERRVKQIMEGPRDERSRMELKRMTEMLSVARTQMMAETNTDARQRLQDRVVDLAKRKSQFEKDCRPYLSAAELSEQRQFVQRDVLLNADVITTTLGSCCSDTISHVLHKRISVCIIDEAGQCKETETWLPLLTGVSKLVLAGDHLQLPPTVLSQVAQGKNMKQSLFERVYYHIATEENKPHLVHR